MIRFYCDGSCLNNPGKGTYAWLNTSGIKAVGPIESITTNNRMELLALWSILRQVIREKIMILEVYSDSSYVVKGFNKWMQVWFSSSGGRRKIKNLDYWKSLFLMKKTLVKRGVNFNVRWIKGHNDLSGNDLAHRFCFNRVRDVA